MSTACCRAGLQGQGIEGEGGQAPEEKLPTQARVLQEPVAEDVVCLQEGEKGDVSTVSSSQMFSLSETFACLPDPSGPNPLAFRC